MVSGVITYRRSRRRSSLSPTSVTMKKRVLHIFNQWAQAGHEESSSNRDGVGIHSSTHVPANGSDNDPHLRIALDPHRDIRSKMESPPSNDDRPIAHATGTIVSSFMMTSYLLITPFPLATSVETGLSCAVRSIGGMRLSHT